MSIKPVMKGYERQWVKCRKCGRVAHYDYVPYSLSNPIMTMPCSHGTGERDMGATRITADEALVEIARAKP
jgi:hypothetical protein